MTTLKDKELHMDKPGIWLDDAYLGQPNLDDRAVPTGAIIVGAHFDSKFGFIRWMNDAEFAAALRSRSTNA